MKPNVMLHMKFLPFCYLEGSLHSTNHFGALSFWVAFTCCCNAQFVLNVGLESRILFNLFYLLSAILPQLSLSKQISWLGNQSYSA